MGSSLFDRLWDADTGVDDPSRIYKKNGYPVVDTGARTRDGRVPTHRLDVPSGRAPSETWEGYERRVNNRTSWTPDTTARNDIGSLEPDVQPHVTNLLNAARAAGQPLRVGETRRSTERQEMLFQKGRAPGQSADPVTWTLTSDHTPGRATDFQASGTPEQQRAAYQWLQQHAPQHGFGVLGDFDPGHVAMPAPASAPPQSVQSVPPVQSVQGPPRGAGKVAKGRGGMLASAGRATGSGTTTPPNAPASFDDLWDSTPAPQNVARETMPHRATLDDDMRAAAQGASFGVSDELRGGMRAVLPKAMGGEQGWNLPQNYRTAVTDERQRLAQFRQEHPIRSTADELGGGLISALATRGAGAAGMAETGASLGARMARNAFARHLATGGVAGAVAGAGAAEGGLGERVKGAGKGAVAGGLGATILGGLGSAITAPIRPFLGNIEDRASRMLGSAIARDRQTIPQIRAAAAQAGNKPVTIMDVAGENTRGLGRGAQSVMGQARQDVTEGLTRRAEGQMGRVVGDVEGGLGQQRGNVFQTADDLLTARRAHAKPLYEAAYATAPVDDPLVHELFELPEFRAAYERGRRLARVERVNLPKLSDLGSADAPPAIPVQGLDYMKRGLDALIEARAGSAKAISRTEARALRGRLEEALAKIDELRPEYGAARSQYASDSRMTDALESGRDFLARDPREVQAAMRTMTPGEREVYRYGAIDAVRGKMDRTADGRDLTRVITGNDQDRARLRALFGNDRDVATFEQAMETERRMAATKNMVTGGSPTARIQDEQGALGDAGTLASTVMTGNPRAVLMALARSTMAQRARGLTTATADALSPRLTAGLPGQMPLGEMLNQIEQRSAQQAQRTGRRAWVPATLFGNQAGLNTSNRR